jgi:ELWxxDGT repeat protein
MAKPLRFCFFILFCTFLAPVTAQNIRFMTGLPVLKAGSSADKDLVFQAQALDGRIFFVAGDGGQNYELWITDGRPEGTIKLKDLNGNDAALPYGFTLLNHRLIFAATDSETGTELWVSDGTRRGTQLLKDILPGTGGSEPRRLTLLKNRVVFFAAAATGGAELWATDGTAEGTRLLKDLNPDGSTYEGFAAFNTEKPLPVVDGKVYFSGRTNGVAAGNDPALIESDGTTDGTRVLINNVESAALAPVKMGNAIYFLANSDGSPTALWKSDLTTFATAELAPITSFREPVLLGQKIFFANGTALWETDGTTAGTKKTTAVTHTNPANLTVFNNKLYLYGTSGSNKALLRFDGTNTPESLSNTLNTGADYAPVVVNGKLYAPLQTSSTQYRMIATDGATQSFVFTATAPSATIPYASKNLFAFNNELYFSASVTPRGNELWKIAAATNKAVLVKDVNPGPVSADPRLAGIAGTQLFLFTATGLEGREFWMSQGTTDNTRQIGNLNPGSTYGNAVLDNSTPVLITDSLLVQADSMAFWMYDIHEQTSQFVFQHPDYQTANPMLEQVKSLGGGGALLKIANGNVDELWLSLADEPVTKIFENSNIVDLGQLAGAPVFSATVPNACTKLHIYNDPGNDPQVLMTTGDKVSCRQNDFRYFHNKLYFVSQNGTGTNTVWESNGTTAGTKQFLNVSVYKMLWEFNGELYFIVKSGSDNNLWKTDGTVAGSHAIFNLGTSNFPLVVSTSTAALGDDIYFTSYDVDANVSSLVATDGTTVGTRIIQQFRSTGPYLVATSNRVFFTANDDEHGKELWYTDGTPQGTDLIDVIAGDSSSLVDFDLEGPDLGVLNDNVYFRVYDRYTTPLNGNTPTSLWVTDGTEQNTHAVINHNGEEKFTNPKTFFPYLGELYFSAGGTENYGLWQITEGTGSLEVSFEGNIIQRNQPVDWGYVRTNDPQTGTLVLRNNSAHLLTLEDISWNNEEFHFTIDEIPVTIAPNGELEIPVEFESAEKARRSTQVTLTTDIVNDPAFVFTIEVTTTEAALVTATPVKDNPTYCPGEEAVFAADPVVNGGFSPIFEWKRNGETVGTTNVPEFAYPTLEHGDEVSVVLIPSEDALAATSSATSNEVTVTVLTPSATTVQIHADHTGSAAPGSTIVVTAQTTNAGLNPAYQWFLNDEPLEDETAAALTFVAPEQQGPLTFKLQVTSDAPCPTNVTVFSNEVLLDIVTGLEDPADLQLTMYPNPANDKLYISNGAGKPVQASVLDTRGSSWGRYEGTDIMVDTSGMPEGLYFVRVQVGKRVTTRKVIVARE